MTRSLGFATDLALRVLEGAVLERRGAATVVRTAANPAFRWGNLVLAPRVDEGPEHWAAVHRAAFPDAAFVTIGVDDADAALDEPAWTRAGFAVERLAVLAAAVPPTSPPAAGRVVRPLRTDADWAAVTAIEADEGQEAEDAEYSSRRLAQRRSAVAAGRAVWFGVQEDGAVVATAGIADAGDGTARFQDVQTLTASRRRGHAGALVAAAAQEAAARFGSTRFVIVAEPDGPAIGLYRRLGLHDVETQVQLSRVDDRSPAAGAVGAGA